MTTTIDSLANETLSEIFAALASSDLCHAALVCCCWRDPAQLALFSHVELLSQGQADAWLASPTRERFRIKGMKFGYGVRVENMLAIPPIAGSVVSRERTIPPSERGQSAFRLSHLMTHLGEDVLPEVFSSLLLPSISTLSSLTTRGFQSPTSLAHAKSFFASHPSPIQRLTFGGENTLSLILNFLPIFATLHSLSVEDVAEFLDEHGYTNDVEDAVSRIAAAVPPTVEKLAFSGTNYRTNLLGAVRSALELAPLGNLKRLDLPDWDEAKVREAVGGEERRAAHLEGREHLKKGASPFDLWNQGIER